MQPRVMSSISSFPDSEGEVFTFNNQCKMFVNGIEEAMKSRKWHIKFIIYLMILGLVASFFVARSLYGIFPYYQLHDVK